MIDLSKVRCPKCKGFITITLPRQYYLGYGSMMYKCQLDCYGCGYGTEIYGTSPEQCYEKILSMNKEKLTQNCKNHQDTPTRKSILDAAAACVCGDRDQQYGGPETSFRMIAELWEPYIRHKCVSAGADVTISAEDVAAMMVLFKMARVATGSYKADSWIDAAGYAACGGEIAGGRDNG